MRPRLLRLWSSIVTYIAAMIAMYISMRLHLPRPWWVLMSVYVTTQPLAGTMRPKMAYRLLGVVVGAAAAVILVPHFVNYPAVLVLALAVWIGFCLYFAILDRTPRTFGFMLAAYTAAIVGFPYLDQPGDIFQIALDRVEEMWLAIACATVAHTVLLPWNPIAALSRRTRSFLGDGRHWFADAFRGAHGFEEESEKRRFAADVAELSIIAVHLPAEAFSAAVSRRFVGALQDEMAVLLPLASAAEDRLDALRQRGTLPPIVATLVDDVVAWLAQPEAPPEEARVLGLRSTALARDLDAGAGWDALLAASLCQKIAEFIAAYANASELAARLTGPPSPLSSRARRLLRRQARRSLHQHHPMALLSAVGAAFAVVAYCSIWILTAWPEGAATAAFAAIISCSFSSQDDPAPGIVKYLAFTLAALPISAVYLFGLLPAVDGVTQLSIALAPALIFMGYIQSDPARAPYALPMLACFIVAMGFLDRWTVDYARFYNVATAQIGGVIATIGAARLFRSVGAEWSARRIVRDGWRDIARLARAGRGADEVAWSHRMHDRLGLIAGRMAMQTVGQKLEGVDALRDLRVGRNVIRLRRAHALAAADAEAPLAALLAQTADFYQASAARRAALEPPPGLLAAIDAALPAMGKLPAGETRRQGRLALAGLRRNLFPDAPAYQGQAA